MAFSSLRSRVIPLCHRSFSAKPSYRGGKGRGTPVIDSDNETSEEDVPISGISRPLFPELRNQLKKASSSSSSSQAARDKEGLMFDSDKQTPDEDVPTSGISRPLSEILKELNKKVPDSLIKYRHEPNGVSLKYIPWHIVNRIMNLHAPEWSGEVRSVTHSPDGKSVSVVYRVTIYGTDAEIYRESTGTASVDDPGYGDPVQKAEGMAFRRACARFGLGLHLYHEDMS